MLHVGDDVVKKTIENRPYSSIKDYLEKVAPNKQAMVSLIKGGAFDNLMDRMDAMKWYLWETCDKKKNITLQNMQALIKYHLLPTTEDGDMSYKIYEFNRYLKAKCKYNNISYKLDERAIHFLEAIDQEGLIDVEDKQECLLNIKQWDKVYQKYMLYFKTWITAEKDKLLSQLNNIIFQEDWEKYAHGTISSWEMEVLCFYHHDHELKNVNKAKYGFVNYFNLPSIPIVESESEWRGHKVQKFKINKICGTCIAKNKVKNTVSLLTLDGVVEIKFSKEFFALFDKRISARQPDGSKKIIETSWFDRGSMIAVQGFRRDDNFVAKKYSSTSGHQIYKIDKVYKNGDIDLRPTRVVGDTEEDE